MFDIVVVILKEGHMSKRALRGIPIGECISSSQKIWNCFQALGNIPFAYAYSLVLVEIQASYSNFIRKSMLIAKQT